MCIPKIIHQLWIGPKPAPDKWMRTWRELHPGWEYVLWDERRIEAMHWTNQRHIEHYWREQAWHGVSDVCQYEILYTFGGIMTGADSECLHPVDELFQGTRYDAFAVYEQERIRPGLMSPLMACTVGNEFARALIVGLSDKKELTEKPWRETGNLYMKIMYERTRYKRLKIFPSHYFNTPHYTGHDYHGPDRKYARQYWGTTKGLY